ncbi:MAG: AMP-binding protein [Rhodospirillales bacterium]|jgi:long-chain acyl-CoA synthetase|nr:AMP-binding protein [Rhodospirillales bacterium]MDP6644506.1 AMP-binding protein [Rhodospirillales bacterium]|tara:strand:+ start:2248 stop:3792 length:1545 start_codon:yes stop_codon:yes gene_type:complete
MDKRTLGQVLAANIAHHGNRAAMIDGQSRSTYSEFGARIFKLAKVLADLGLSRGDRFAIFAKNGRSFEELRWAGFVSGIVPVAVNWRLAPPEIEHVLNDSACDIVFLDEDYMDVFEHPDLRKWQDGLQQIGAHLEARIVKAEATGAPAQDGGIDPDDDAMLFYTGGTTGRSKGVRLSHWNIISCGLAFGLGLGARPDDVFLHVAPMFHSADLLATGWFLNGAAHCYLPAFSPAGVLQTITENQASVTVMVPAMLMAVIGWPGLADADTSSLKTLIYGASPMAFEWVERVAAAFPDADFLNCYGLTEAAPDLTIFEAKAFRAAIESGDRNGIVTSVGKPNMLVDLRVVGPDGTEVEPGEDGELWARGPNIMKGYLNLPEETASAVSDDWLHTGDLARIDGQGYVYLLDRLKDLVITGGENVYSSEVEAALHRHTSVSEAAVIGVADDRLGESLFAVIVLRPDAEATPEELISHCRSLIGGFKIPRRYAFVDTLPKSALGKVLKAELRSQYATPSR